MSLFVLVVQIYSFFLYLQIIFKFYLILQYYLTDGNMLLNFNNLEINNLHPETEFEKKIFFFIKEWLSNAKSVKVQTSGSTGTPKVFEIEKNKMLHSAKMTCDFLHLREGDKALICLPIEYISGKMMVARSVERNLQLIVENPSLQSLENLNMEIDFCAMTPLQVENSLHKIHCIKNLIIGGATVSESLKDKISQTLKSSNSKNKIYETYGMSETLSHIALKEIYPHSDEYFTVLKDVEISLDERGCLKIFAPKLNEEVLQTNDLVEINHFKNAQCEKKQFKFLGRIDNVINSGGAKIFPEQLETLIKKEISNEVIFLGLKDESLGQKLILVIEGSENENLKSQILNLKFEKSFHRPKEIIFIEKIPRTPNGKVNRLELKSIIEESYQ